MPELPEVETVRRAIRPELEGRRVASARICHPRTARRHARCTDVEDRLVGRGVRRVGRHGKFLLIGMEAGLTWVMHLGMSGRIRLCEPGDPKEVHTRFWAEMEQGPSLRMIDPRTFGFVAVYTPEELEGSTLARLGADAWDDLPSAGRLFDAMRSRTIPIKSLLLDQRFVAGLGNIYSDEVLHRAGVHPSRRSGGLSEGEVDRIRSEVRPVLAAGISRGGTSLDDLAYLLPDGRAGGFLEYLRVYGREGLPCRSCESPIRRMVINARSSFFCPECQAVP